MADCYLENKYHKVENAQYYLLQIVFLYSLILRLFAIQDESTPLIVEIQDPFFLKLLSYIDENIDDESLSGDKLCDRLGISKSALYNKTKSVLGTTPHGLINQRRVKKASLLLDSTTLSVSEIIDHTGFNSRAHFYELFNKTFGCSPSEYRQKRKVEV